MRRKKKNYSLFVLLLACFLTLTLIPGIFFITYFAAAARTPIERNLIEQCSREIDDVEAEFQHIFAEYRHKAYALSVHPLLTELLQNGKNALVSDSDIYKALFSVMKGDVYRAAAHLVSVDGKIRYSTHYFPSGYNPRSNSGVYSIFNEVDTNFTTDICFVPSSRKENKNPVSLTLAKKIYNKDALIGYVFIDLFEEVFLNTYDRPLFSDIVLIDGSSFLAYSLLTRDLYGDFGRFPALTALPSPLADRVYRKNDYFTAVRPLADNRFFIAGILDASSHFESFYKTLSNLAPLLIIPALFSIILAVIFSKLITSPVKSLLQTMKAAKTGNLKHTEGFTRISDFAELSEGYNRMTDEILLLIEKTRQEEIKLHEAQRKALEAQINPHFLSNTLGTVKSLAKLHKQTEIAEIVTELSKLLRYSIGNTGSFISVKEAAELAESWIRIMKIRFGDKLKTDTGIDPACEKLLIPSFIIQPFLENAVIHGLEPKTGDWFLSLNIRRDTKRIVISIKDNGIGFPEGFLEEGFEHLKESSHTGLYNVYKRLELLYEGSADIDIQSGKTGTAVHLFLPILKKLIPSEPLKEDV